MARLSDKSNIFDVSCRTYIDHITPYIISTLNQLFLEVRHLPGNELEPDVSCDITYMLIFTNRVGTVIQESYQWVDINDQIYFMSDNVGGCDPNDVLIYYTYNLK